jgi:Tol biopolymer transport system component
MNIDGTNNKLIYTPDKRYFNSGGKSFSRNGKKMVFSRIGSGMKIYDLESGTFTFLDIDGSSPHLSPDGNKIVFFSYKDGQLYTMNSDRTDLKRITHDNNSYSSAYFTPDGNRIITSYGNSLYSMNTDGSDMKAIFTDKNGFYFKFSPDGSKIGYITNSQSDTNSNNLDVYTVNIDGSNKKFITNITPNYSSEQEIFIWSPDGKQIAFVNELDLYTINSDGTSQKRLTNDYLGYTHDIGVQGGYNW